jgi:hypothetical protein
VAKQVMPRPGTVRWAKPKNQPGNRSRGRATVLADQTAMRAQLARTPAPAGRKGQNVVVSSKGRPTRKAETDETARDPVTTDD